MVLGAGPAGLAAAYGAAQRGCQVVLVERAAHVGGLAASFELAGVRVDHGSHRLHPATDPAILAELQDLLGADLQRRRRNGRIRLAGRWIPFPFGPTAAVRALPPSFALGTAVDAVTGWTRRARADTFAEYVRATLGPTMAERFYFPYARKLWGRAPTELSAEHARRRIRASGPAALAARLVRGRRGERGTFFYPRRGYGQLWERLADAAVAAGVDLRLETPARCVRLADDRVEVDTDAAQPIRAARAWSTLPITALARLAEPAPPEPVRTAAAALHQRAMVLIYVVLATGQHTPYDAHYLPEGWTPITRVSEPKNYRDGGAADPADRTVLCAELPCERDDQWWRTDDAELGDVVVDTLRAAGLDVPEVVEVAVRRLPGVYPVYPVGFEAHFEALDEWVTGHSRLLSFGRQGLFVHDNAHHALAMGWAAAAALHPGGAFDDAAWQRARQRFREHVVED